MTYLLTGASAGLLVGLLGIGGATLTIPFLLWHRVDIRAAVGTAAACGLPIALAGAAGFALSAGTERAPGLHTGFLYWPAVGGIAITSVLLAPLGARLAHHLPRQTLRRVFAAFLVVVGVKMILGA
jgi:hypothetical protein